MNKTTILMTALLLLTCGITWAETSDQDSVQILAVLPEGPVERGVEIELTIDVEADLQSAHEGVAMVGFNLNEPTAFVMKDSRKLEAGTQRFTFVVKVVPVDWQERGDFTVYVNMGPEPDGARWTPTTGDNWVLELAP